MTPIINSVVNQYNWTPQVISEMYCDDLDFLGLTYWYEEVKQIVDKSKIKK